MDGGPDKQMKSDYPEQNIFEDENVSWLIKNINTKQESDKTGSEQRETSDIKSSDGSVVQIFDGCHVDERVLNKEVQLVKRETTSTKQETTDPTILIEENKIIEHVYYSQEHACTNTKDKAFITESQVAGSEVNSSLSENRADTPIWPEDGGDGPDDMEENAPDMVQMPGHDNLVNFSAGGCARPFTGSTVGDTASGQRAVVNTPVSYLTTADYAVEVEGNINFRNASQSSLDAVREAAFRRAMTLMVSREGRQAGVEQDMFGNTLDHTYGPKCPQFFYVQQTKPVPLAPLKAWRGYHGNVYFEPMHIQQVGSKDNYSNVEVTHKPPPSIASRKSANCQRSAHTPGADSQALVPYGGDQKEVKHRASSRSVTRLTNHRKGRPGTTSAKSVASSSMRSVADMSQHHLLCLDKQAISKPSNAEMYEELQVLEKQQATGSLSVRQKLARPQQPGQHVANERPVTGGLWQGGRRTGSASIKFDRVCRGSVAHKLHSAHKTTAALISGQSQDGALGQQANKNNTSMAKVGDPGRKPAEESTAVVEYHSGRGPLVGREGAEAELVVVGDRFAPSALMSPLLRTQTQFSLSSQRTGTHSPDLYGAFQRLPHLEQVRLSLRHMDVRSVSEQSYSSRVNTPYSTVTNRLNTPYSRETNRINSPYSSLPSRPRLIENLKPFIKYSPEVKARYNHQLKYY